MHLLQTSYNPNFFIRSRKKDSCPRPNAVDGSLIYKDDNQDPIRNQQSHENVRFPHGTEVRFDCLRTEPDISLDDEIDGADEEDDATEEEGNVADEEEYDDGEEDGIDEINFRMKRAIGKNVKSNRRNKQKSRNTNRRNRPKTTGDSNYARNNIEQQNQLGIEMGVEGGGTKVKYRSWKIVCSDGRWIGKSLGCDENGHPLLEDETSSVDYNPFNASCPFSNDPASTNLQVFYDDREIRMEGSQNQMEYFAPGAELVFRCKDIGM